MFAEIRRLSRQTLTYGLGTVLSRLVAFILLPFFTHELPPAEFGVYVLFYIFISVVIEFLRLGLDIALLRFYVPESDPDRRRVIFSTVMWAALGAATVVCGAVWLGAEGLVGLIVSAAQHPEWQIHTLKLCALILWLDTLSALPLVVMRGENRAMSFALVKLSGAVVQVAATIVLLAVFERGVRGIFEANLIASAFTLALCLPITLKRLRPVFDAAMLTACLGFGLPNIPTALFVQVIQVGDRKILELLRTPEEVGLYSAGYRLGMFMSIAAMAFRFAWQPFFLQMSNRPDAQVVYGRVLTYFVAAAAWIFLALAALVPPLAKWNLPGVGALIDPVYWDGLGVFPIILLAHVFNGLFAVFIVGVYLQKRTRVLPVITGAAMLLNLGGNLLLVPHYGMWASAWLTVAAYAAMAGLLYAYIQRHYPIPYEWGRVIKIAVVAGLVYAAVALTDRFGFAPLGWLAAVLFPAFLLLFGVATPGERERLGIVKRQRP